MMFTFTSRIEDRGFPLSFARSCSTRLHTETSASRTTQVWEAEVRDEQDRVVATGRVRLLSVARDAAIG